jgi:hypothetical protein
MPRYAPRTPCSTSAFLFDSDGALYGPGSDVVGRVPGIFEDHDLVGPEDGALEEMARSMRSGSAGESTEGIVPPPETPPASNLAVFPVTVLPFRVTVPASLRMPPPYSLATFPVTVLWFKVTVLL